MSARLPAIFFGHGNPMNAIARNGYTESWSRIGAETRRPKAILAISAHWYVRGTGVTISSAPETIHDFGGFPKELFAFQYPAPGDPQLSHRVRQLLSPLPVQLDSKWGLDHGTWAVLCHVYPKADVPIVQLSIDANKPASWHFEIGRRLAPLREEGVLIVGSGNVVHNLRAYAWGQPNPAPYDWALRFEDEVRKSILGGDEQRLVEYESLGADARLSIPTPEHYLPLLYVLGARLRGEQVGFPVSGIEGCSISMLAVSVGDYLGCRRELEP